MSNQSEPNRDRHQLTGLMHDISQPRTYGDYAVDCGFGRSAGNQTIALIRQSDNPTVLGHVLEALPTGDAAKGVRIGFATALALALLS